MNDDFISEEGRYLPLPLSRLTDDDDYFHRLVTADNTLIPLSKKHQAELDLLNPFAPREWYRRILVT